MELPISGDTEFLRISTGSTELQGGGGGETEWYIIAVDRTIFHDEAVNPGHATRISVVQWNSQDMSSGHFQTFDNGFIVGAVVLHRPGAGFPAVIDLRGVGSSFTKRRWFLAVGNVGGDGDRTNFLIDFWAWRGRP